MSINQLQRDAFNRSPDFTQQVYGIVTKEALYKASTWTNLTPQIRQELAIISKHPQDFGFVNTIISDVAWNIGYDTWATDPAAQVDAIGSAVNTWWQFCTGYANVQPPPPETPA